MKHVNPNSRCIALLPVLVTLFSFQKNVTLWSPYFTNAGQPSARQLLEFIDVFSGRNRLPVFHWTGLNCLTASAIRVRQSAR